MKKILTITTMAAVLAAVPALANDGKMEAKADHYFEQMDTDNDGKISREEHDAFSDKMFTEADTNKDGAVSRDEMMAQKKKEKADFKAGKKASE